MWVAAACFALLFATSGKAEQVEVASRDTAFRAGLLELYARRGGAPIWLRDGAVTEQARSLAGALRTAADQGLRSEDYDGLRWTARLDDVASLDEGSLLALDVAFSAAVMEYVSHLALGRIDPAVFGNAGANRQRLDLAGIVADLAVSDDVEAALTALEPPFPAYRRVLLALERHRLLESMVDPEPIPDANGTVELGTSWSGVARLSSFLRLVGDLAEETSPTGSYEGALVEAVQRFQRRHGLEPDGRIGRATLRALRTPLHKRVVQLELTLERMRSLPRKLDGPPLVVNVPAFRLIADAVGDQPPLDMKVVVGKAFRHETPPFVSDVRQVIFRPYWYVPKGILKKEVLPELRQRPGLFEKLGYEIVDRHGQVVGMQAPDAPLRRKLRNGTLLLRQRPGRANPLGPVKFVLPNRYDVYLHGTPATALFAQTRRDFSHGCIRVEDPVGLAAWVLRDDSGWTRERVKEAMGGDVTKAVEVTAGVPVLVVYATAAVNAYGEVLFFEDVYDEDEALLRALAREPARTG